MGKVIHVPQRYRGLAVLGAGQCIELRAGRNRIRPPAPGEYELFLIDISDQTALVRAQTCTADGWQVSLEAKVTWHVASARRFIFIREPVQLVYDECRQALSDFIRANLHDRLAGAPGVRPISQQSVAAAIKNHLDKRAALPGIALERVQICRCAPDPQRAAELQRVNSEAARCQADQTIMARRFELERQRLAQRNAILDSEYELNRKTIEYNTRADVEQGRGRAELARLRAEEGVWIEKRRRQGVATDNLSSMQDREYHLALEAMKRQAEVNKELATSLGTAYVTLASSPTALANMDDRAIIPIATVAREVNHGLPYTPDKDRIPGYVNEPPATIRSANGQGIRADEYFRRPAAK